MAKVLAIEMGEGVRMPTGRDADARKFYGAMLGLRETMRAPGEKGVWFASGDVVFKVTPDASFTPASQAPAARFRVDKAEAMRQALDRARLRHYDAPPEAGTRGFYALDPFGNRLELRERPGA